MTDEKKPEGLQRIPQPALPTTTFRLQPGSLGEAMEMAKLISQTELCPKAYRGKATECIVAYEFGAALGLSWLQALRSVSVIQGQAALWGDAVPALILGSGQCERFHEYFDGKPYEDTYTAVCIIKRKGLPDETVRRFNVAQAKVAKIWQKRGREGQDTPWITHPDRMLQMRARGFAARDSFPDKLSGLILAEEAMDYPDAIEGTVVSSVPATDPLERVPEGLRDQIGKAFETLSLSPGMRLAKVNEFLGPDAADPEAGAQAILDWCKDEYAKRKTGQPRKKDDNGKRPNAPAKSETKADDRPADPDAHADGTGSAEPRPSEGYQRPVETKAEVKPETVKAPDGAFEF